MATQVKLLGGRVWKRTADGKDGATVKYRIVMDQPLAANREAVDLTGIPKPGDEHPIQKHLVVASVDYEEEGSVGAERIVIAKVNYEPRTTITETIGTGVTCEVEKWGFEAGTEEKDLLNDITTGLAVLNSAHDPFDQAPKVSAYTPIFTKAFKTVGLLDGALAFNCKLNSDSVMIGGETFAARTLMCSVSVEQIFGDPDWNFRYTIQLKYRSNMVDIAWDGVLSEVGWQAAVVDAGMRELDPDDEANTRRIMIRRHDPEGNYCMVSSPALLDGSGRQLSETMESPTPYVMKFDAYEEVEFPSYFYSRPIVTA